MVETGTAFESLSAEKRVRVGSVAMAVGVALIGVLGFATVPSQILRVVLGVASVAAMVVGVLLVGTSEKTV